MDLNAVDKFAELFAKCAATGDSAPLRKEAAAQSLVKEAITASQLLLPLGGAAIGGAAGYLGTDNEKRKLRNALYGALSGGVAGAGTQLALPMFKDIASQFSGSPAPATAGQGGGQFSVADSRQPAAAPGAPAAPAAPAQPATGGASNAAAKPGEQTSILPTVPDVDNHTGTSGPLTTYRLVNDAAAAGFGYRGMGDFLARFAPGGQSGFRDSLKRISDKFPEVNKLLARYAANPKAPMSEFLAKPPIAPATFTTPKPEFAEAAPRPPGAAPQRPLPPAGRTGKSRSGKPSANAAVPIKDYLQNLRRFASQQATYNDAVAAYPQQQAAFDARRAAFPQSQAMKDWEAASQRANLAARQHQSETAAFNKAQPGKEQAAKTMFNRRSLSDGAVTQDGRQMKMLEEMLRRNGANLTPERMQAITEAVNKAKATRPSSRGIFGAKLLGGLGLGVGAEFAGQNVQNALADALAENPNYNLGDMGKDIGGTIYDLIGRRLEPYLPSAPPTSYQQSTR